MISTGQEAFNILLDAANHDDDHVDFDEVMAPALQHYIVAHEPETDKKLLRFVYKHIPDERAEDKATQAFFRYLKETDQLTKKSKVFANVIESYFIRGNSRLILALCAINGIRLDEPLTQNGITILHFAARFDCVEILEEAQRIGISLDCKTKAGLTPLFFAGSRRTISKLLELGADINAQNNEGNTAALEALRLGKKDVLKYFLEKPEIYHIKNKKGRNLLEEAYAQFSQERSSYNLVLCIEVFYAGVKAKAYPLSPFKSTQFEILIDCSSRIDEEFVDRELSLEAKTFIQDLVREYQARKVLGHANSIKNQDHFPYEGCLTDAVNGSLMERAFADCLADLPEDAGISKGERDRLKGAYLFTDRLRSAFKIGGHLLNAVEQIQRGDLVIVPTGFKRHRIEVVFFKGYYIICNRGMGAWTTPTIRAYKIDPRKMTSELLKKILITEKPNEGFLKSQKTRLYRLFNFFPSMAAKLSPNGKAFQDTLCKRLEKISPKMQSVGNCTFTAPKTALRAALALMRVDVDDARTWDEIDAIPKVAKTTSTAMRLQFLEDYVSGRKVGPLRDEYLIGEALKKIKKHLLKHPVSLDPFPHVQALLQT